MRQDDSMATLDSFMSRSPENDRVDVLVIPRGSSALEKKLAPWGAGRKIRVFDHEDDIVKYCAHLEGELKYAKHRRLFNEAMQQIFSFEFKPTGAQGSFRWSLLNRFGASEGNFDPVYLLKKDKISPENVSRFLTAFTRVAPVRRPKIVYDAEGSYGEGIAVLSAVRDSIQPYSPALGGLTRLDLTNWVAPKERFVDMFGAGALASCADTDLGTPLAGASIEELRCYTVMAHQRIQALKGCDRKFDAGSRSEELVAVLREQLTRTNQADVSWFGEALIFALLDQAYIDETKHQNIDEALTLAKSIGDKTLVSFAGRFINFTAGVSPFASKMLDDSANGLAQAGHFVESCYARANKLATDIHRIDAVPSTHEWRGLVDMVLEWAPYCDRLSSILNAAGVAAMLANHLSEARDLFTQASQANGARIHQISADINLEMVNYLAGEQVSSSRIESIAHAIRVARMSRKLDYHHVYMYANLAKLSPSDDVKGPLNEILRKERYLSYTDEEIDSGQLLSFLARHFQWISDGQRFRGIRGDFVERHGLLPICPFIWS